jgi:hypothetical protein
MLGISFYFSIEKTLNTTDIHHWSMITFSIDNFLTKIPYAEIYEQYGILMPLLLSPLTYFADTKVLVGTFVALIFILNSVLIFKITAEKLNKNKAIIILLFYLIAYPRIQYPWPDYFAGSLILAYLFISIRFENSNVTSLILPIFVSLALFAREVIIFQLLILLVFLIGAFYLYRSRFYLNHLKFLILGIFSHYIILISYLAHHNAVKNFFLQTFNFVYWTEANQPIDLSKNIFLRTIVRFEALLYWGSRELKYFFFILVVSALLVFWHFLSLRKEKNIDHSVFLMAFFGISGFVMTFHIPEIFRLQIYSFILIVSCLILTEKYASFNFTKVISIKKYHWFKFFFLIKDKNTYFLFLTLFFLLIFSGSLKNRYLDASSENLIFDVKGKQSFYSFQLKPNVINFYNELFLEWKKTPFINKTPDPLIEKLLLDSKMNPGTSFYSPDFNNRINFKENLRYDYFLVNNISHTFYLNNICRKIGKLPDGVAFLSGNEYYICKN